MKDKDPCHVSRRVMQTVLLSIHNHSLFGLCCGHMIKKGCDCVVCGRGVWGLHIILTKPNCKYNKHNNYVISKCRYKMCIVKVQTDPIMSSMRTLLSAIEG